MALPIKRGDIFIARFPYRQDSNLIYGNRPVVVVSNNIANRFSSVINVIPITSKNKKSLPTHVRISGFGLNKPSTVLAEQIISIDKADLEKKLGALAGTIEMQEINRCLRMQIDVA